jgi:hypothetical protein
MWSGLIFNRDWRCDWTTPSLGGKVSLSSISPNQDLVGGVQQFKVTIREKIFGQVQTHICEHSTNWAGVDTVLQKWKSPKCPFHSGKASEFPLPPFRTRFLPRRWLATVLMVGGAPDGHFSMHYPWHPGKEERYIPSSLTNLWSIAANCMVST